MLRPIISTLLPLLLALALQPAAQGQTPWTTELDPAWLSEVMPEADVFSDKEGDPPVIRGYRDNRESGEQELVGYLYLSADVPPEEQGYSAPIDMLIGLHVEGHLTGIKILDYTESYVHSRGDFLSDGVFQRQFRNKNINDDFRLGGEVNGVARATISSWAVARGLRNSARRVAQAYLGHDEEGAQQRAWGANALERMQPFSWQELLDRGTVEALPIPPESDEGSELLLYISYLGREALGEYFIGLNAYSQAERDASVRGVDGDMVLVAIAGNAQNRFRQEGLALQQGEAPARPVPRQRFVYAGNASEGKLAGRARYAGAIVLDDDIDVTRPFSVIYSPPDSDQAYSREYRLDEIGTALALNEPVLSEREIEQAMLAEAGVFTRLHRDPPWGEVAWPKVAMLLLIFALVMAAFLRNNAALRWTALSITLLYLGFIDGGFLSVSHITAVIAQGPGILLNNLPILLIVTFTLVTTLLWGRVFCSSLCPFGALQDIINRLTPRRWQLKMPQWLHDRALYIKYAILALIIGAALFYSQLSIFQYFEPFGTLFFFSSSVLLWAILIAILLASVVVERFYCRYLCPLGAALGVLSLLSPWRIKRVPQCDICKVCEHACPTGAIRGPDIDFKECVRCDICESKLINKAGVCRHDMDVVASRHKNWQAVSIRN